MNPEDHLKSFIQAYDLEKFENDSWNHLSAYLDQKDIEDDTPWACPPAGMRYNDLAIYYHYVELVITTTYPIFKARYKLFLKEGDLNPYYTYEMNFNHNNEIINWHFTLYNLPATI